MTIAVRFKVNNERAVQLQNSLLLIEKMRLALRCKLICDIIKKRIARYFVGSVKIIRELNVGEYILDIYKNHKEKIAEVL